MAKVEHDKVFGGTMVVEGSALMRVTACGDDSTLGRIISTVQSAQASKPPIQELADRVARYFVPVITVVSGATFAVWVVAYWCGVVPKGWYAEAGSPYLFAFFFALVRIAVIVFMVCVLFTSHWAVILVAIVQQRELCYLPASFPI